MRNDRPEHPEEVKKAQGLDGQQYRLMYYPAEAEVYWVEAKIEREWLVMTKGKFRTYRDADQFLNQLTDKDKL